MEYLSNIITIDNDLCNGKPTIRGMRISVQTVLSYLRAGETKESIIENFPMLTIEDIDACLDYAIRVAGIEMGIISLKNVA